MRRRMDVDDQQECQYVSEGVPAYRWRIKFFVGAHSCTFYVCILCLDYTSGINENFYFKKV